MNKKYTEEQKQAVINQFTDGMSVVAIVSNTGIPRSTVYAWIKIYQTKQNKKEVSLKNFRVLEAKVKRLEGIIEILQNVGCRVDDPLDIKLYALEQLYGQYSVHMLCDALKVSRGTFYNHVLRNKKDNTWYAKRREEYSLKIQQIYDDSNQIFGAAKIATVMKDNGYRISVEMVRKLMRDMGLISIRQDAKDLYDKEQRRYKNYLNQQFTTTRPNEVWVSDITYFGSTIRISISVLFLIYFHAWLLPIKWESKQYTTCQKYISNGLYGAKTRTAADFSYGSRLQLSV